MHFQHAEKRLSEARSELDRIDVIAAVKRAVDARITFIARAYNWKQVPGLRNAPNRFEALRRAGIIRPIMSKELFDARHRIEHDLARPPTLRACERYAEFCWYFMAATENIARMSILTVTFGLDEDATGYWASIRRPDVATWNFRISGWFRNAHVHQQPLDTDIRVELTAIGTAGHRRSGRGRPSGDVWVDGRVAGPTASIERIARIFFSDS